MGTNRTMRKETCLQEGDRSNLANTQEEKQVDKDVPNYVLNTSILDAFTVANKSKMSIEQGRMT